MGLYEALIQFQVAKSAEKVSVLFLHRLVLLQIDYHLDDAWFQFFAQLIGPFLFVPAICLR